MKGNTITRKVDGYLYVIPYAGDRYMISKNKRKNWKKDTSLDDVLHDLKGKKIRITVEVIHD